MSRQRRFLAVSAGALAVLVTVAACGSSTKVVGGGSTSPSTSVSGGTASTAAANTPVKIGVLCSCTGAFGGSIADAWKVTQAWGKSVNASGGLQGHPVEFVMKDNGSNPGPAVTNAAALISAKVPVILDLDILDQAWEKSVAAAGIPVIGGNIASDPFYTDPDFYPSGQTNDAAIYSYLATVKASGATNVAIVYCAESPTCAENIPTEKTIGAQLGVPVVYTSSVAATAPNYTAQCLAAKQAGATAMFLADGITVNARVATDCNQQGYHPIYVGGGTGYSNLVLTTPGLKTNYWESFPLLPIFSTQPAVLAMNTVVDKYYPGLRADSENWSEFSAFAWTGGLLIADAAKNADFSADPTVTSANFLTGLNMVSNDTLGGFSPPLTFAAGKPHPVDCWYTARVVNGVGSMVGGQTCHTIS